MQSQPDGGTPPTQVTANPIGLSDLNKDFREQTKKRLLGNAQAKIVRFELTRERGNLRDEYIGVASYSAAGFAIGVIVMTMLSWFTGRKGR